MVLCRSALVDRSGTAAFRMRLEWKKLRETLHFVGQTCVSERSIGSLAPRVRTSSLAESCSKGARSGTEIPDFCCLAVGIIMGLRCNKKGLNLPHH